jgi:excinuclease ABC subunit B
MSKPQLQKSIEETRKRMLKASKDLDFMEAARLRDELFALEKKLTSIDQADKQ